MRQIRNYIATHVKLKLSLLYFCGTLLAVLAMSIFLYGSFHTVFRSKEEAYIQERVTSIAQTLDQTFSDLERKMAGILNNPKVMSLLNSERDPVSAEAFYESAEMEDILKSIYPYSEGLYSFTVIDSKNRVYTNGSSINIFERMDGPLLQQVLRSPYSTLALSRPLFWDQSLLTLAKLIQGDSGVAGVILADVDTRQLDLLLPNIGGEKYYVFITNQDGKTVYANSELEFTQTMLPEKGAEVQTLSLGQDRFLCASSYSESARCFTSILVAENSAFRDSTQLLVQWTLILLLILGQTVFFANLVSVWISKRICRLNSEALSFANTGEPIGATDASGDEIGQLSKGFSYMSREIHSMIAQMQREERQRRQLEFKALQTQINPHMLYNTLNTITYLAQMQNVTNIEEVSLSFTSLMRILAKTEGDYIPLCRELEYLQCYVNIKKYGIMQSLSLRLDVPEPLLTRPILKLLLQPFVENSIKHGLGGCHHSGVILVRAALAEGRLHLSVTDNGRGMSPEQIAAVYAGTLSATDEYTSIGIQNTLNRLRLQYEDRFRFAILSDNSHYTQVQISFPVPEEENHA